MIDKKTIQKLQLSNILSQVAEFAQSNSGKNFLMNLYPTNILDDAQYLQNQTNEARKLINYYNISPGFNFDSIKDIADKAKILSVLSMKELLYVKRMLSLSRNISNELSKNQDNEIYIIPSMSNGLYTNKRVEEEIDFAIINENEMHDRASDELYHIRTSIRKTNDDIKQKLNSYLHSASMSKYLQDSIITMRENRYVIPVKSEYKSTVNGLIHDQSSSGQTLFIEPIAIVELNNKLKQLYIDETAEIERILYEFTKEISKFADELNKNENILTELDAVFSKAKYADSIKASSPILNDNGIFDIKNARHPLINKEKVVPISVKFGDKYNILMITGPNTGGKTVSLKTVGLFSLMAGCGLLLPCYDDSKVALFDNIFCDVGDEQSIEQSLSTFSSHIINIARIVKELNNKSLVLLDEVGAGTEPNEGAALALAITDYILKSGAKGIMTTHFSLLKEYALTTPNIENACMEFNPSNFEPTYKLIIGVPGSSNAIEIAKRLGLNQKIIDNAKSQMSEEKKSFDNVLRQAEDIRQQYETAKNDIEAKQIELTNELKKAKAQNALLAKERENLLYNSKIEAKKIISNAQSEAEELLQSIKEIQKNAANSDEKEIFKARAFAKKINDLRYNIEKNLDEETNDNIIYGKKLSPDELNIGQSVYVKKINSVGIIQSIEKKNSKVIVRIGKINTTVNIDELYFHVDTDVKTDIVKNKTSHVAINKSTVKTEINLLGKNVDEAIAVVDPFIDAAMNAGFNEVRIIHGMGTGALRAGLHRYFKIDKRIKEFRLGKYGEGESGVTIITLKNDK